MTDDTDDVLEAKDPDVDKEYWIDFYDQVISEALPRTDYIAGELLFFAQDTGFLYEVTTAGRTSVSHPRNLPRVSGQTVNYGSCVLTCRHSSEVSEASISSVAWTVPSGLTNASQRVKGLRAFVTLSGGVDGVDYEVTGRMTPSVGSAIDKTITVPVRSQ